MPGVHVDLQEADVMLQVVRLELPGAALKLAGVGSRHLEKLLRR